jgi:hypothetical protein
MRLPDDYLVECEKRARRFMGQWTGTSGSLAADVMRLLKERKEIMASMDEINAGIREAVAARMAGTPADDQKLEGYKPHPLAGCKPAEAAAAAVLSDVWSSGCEACEGSPFVAKARTMEASSRATASAEPVAREALDMPPEFLDRIKHLDIKSATPTAPAEFKVERIGATMSQEQLDAAWAAIKNRREEMMARIRGEGEPIQTEVITPPQRPRIIGLTGPAGCGKNLVASLVPDAAVIQLADPIYAALSAILGIPDTALRQRATKERPIDWLGKSPRQLLQTLGTDWGRTLVAEDIWLRIARRRIEELAASGVSTVVIADVRFDNEARMVQEMGGEVWGVDRGPTAGVSPHVSESGLSPGMVDRVIDNTGTPDQTRANVAAILASE